MNSNLFYKSFISIQMINICHLKRNLTKYFDVKIRILGEKV
jgi:hypothetical protein